MYEVRAWIILEDGSWVRKVIIKDLFSREEAEYAMAEAMMKDNKPFYHIERSTRDAYV